MLAEIIGYSATHYDIPKPKQIEVIGQIIFYIFIALMPMVILILLLYYSL